MTCNHPGLPETEDGLCVLCWKERAEKAESASETSARNMVALTKQNLELEDRAEKAEAICADAIPLLEEWLTKISPDVNYGNLDAYMRRPTLRVINASKGLNITKVGELELKLAAAIDSRDEAEAAAAEMRKVIERVRDVGMGSCHASIERSKLSQDQHNSCCMIHRALSSSCGQGFLPPDKARVLVEALEKISHQSCLLEHPDGCACCLSEAPMIDMADEALRKVKEAQ